MQTIRIVSAYFFLILFSFSIAWAQGRRTGGAQQEVAISGKVIDASSNQALEYATIALLKSIDSTLVTGSVSDAKGAFKLGAAPGKYLLKVQFMGYQTQFKENLVLKAEQAFVNLGTIALSPGAITTLDEVEIRAEKSRMEFSLDKKVFNVGKDLATIGGSAADLLDNIPSLTVDIEGNVSLRGNSGVRLLINGKPSGLTGTDALQQLQSNMIDRIEIITNPSARYEAEGTAGIINIILKKDRRKGWNGSVDLTGGIPHSHNAALNLNHRREKLNFFGSLGARYRKSPRQSFEHREIRQNGVLSILDQNSNSTRGGISGNFRLGADYFFDQNNILTGSLVYRLSDDLNTGEIEFLSFDDLYTLNAVSLRNTEEEEDEESLDYNLSYERKFARKGQKFTMDLVFTTEEESESMDAIEQAFDANYFPLSAPDLQQRINNSENVTEWVLKSDYVHPVGKDGKFEAGYRGSIRDITNTYLVEELNTETQVWENLTNISNDFAYEEDIHAAYLIYGNKLGKFSYQGGIRAELTHIYTELKQTQERNDRNFTNLFPSVYLNYELEAGNALQVNYSRRVRRPRFWDLNPFFSFNNPLSIRSGNPNLNPEFTHSMEVGHVKYWEKASLSSSIYYRHTDDVITRISRVDENGVNTSMPENLATRKDLGAEFALTVEPVKWWDFTLSANVYSGSINGENLGFARQTDFFSYTSRLNSKINIKNVFDVQLMVNYRGAENTPQGQRKSILYTDLGLSKDVMSKKGTFTFRVRDIFNTAWYRYETSGEGANPGDTFFIFREGQWRSRRQVYVGFSYRINQEKRRKRQQNMNFDNMGGEM